MFSVYEVPQEYSSPMALSRGHFGPLGLAQVAPKLWTSIFFQDILGWGSERCCDLFHEIERLDRVGTSTKYILVSRLLWLLGRMMIFVAFFAQSLPRILDVVTCVLLLADFFLDIDVVLTKIEQIPNTYVGTTVRVSRPRVASACRVRVSHRGAWRSLSDEVGSVHFRTFRTLDMWNARAWVSRCTGWFHIAPHGSTNKWCGSTHDPSTCLNGTSSIVLPATQQSLDTADLTGC